MSYWEHIIPTSISEGKLFTRKLFEAIVWLVLSFSLSFFFPSKVLQNCLEADGTCVFFFKLVVIFTSATVFKYENIICSSSNNSITVFT